MIDDAQFQLEDAIARLSRPINGQYPRPWMTTTTRPWSARVFIVGRNQKNGFGVSQVGGHDRYIDSLFNRNGQSCRGLYDKIVAQASPTRTNTDRFVAKFATQGVPDILETNVICYSTPMSADLRSKENAGGVERGTDIFQTVLRIIKPRVIVAHGAGTVKDLSRLLGTSLPTVPIRPEVTARSSVAGTDIWVIPSLAPPQWNSWVRWADHHLNIVVKEVANFLSS